HQRICSLRVPSSNPGREPIFNGSVLREREEGEPRFTRELFAHLLAQRPQQRFAGARRGHQRIAEGDALQVCLARPTPELRLISQLSRRIACEAMPEFMLAMREAGGLVPYLRLH